MISLSSPRGARAGLAALLALFAPLAACQHTSPEPRTAEQKPGAVATGAGETTAGETTAHAPAPRATSFDSPYEGRWWRDDVFYEIFVRSFADSDGDGIGDLEGLTAKLDYLNDGDPSTTEDLGVDALWLMPIHPSPSYHGYDVTDYRAINPDYGTLEDFDRFLAEAHKRGIRVIIDFVLNHSSSEHPWFQAAARGDARYRDYYVWRDAPDPRFKRPWDGASVWHEKNGAHYLGLFWSGMPDLNLENEAVVDEMVASMRFWLDRGVDGFRVDAVRHLVETDTGERVQMTDTEASHALAKRIRARLHETHPEALLVAEAWSASEDIARYYGDGDEFPLAFSFGASGAILASVRDGQRVHLMQTLDEAARVFVDRGFEAPFLTNHDMPRIARLLESDLARKRLAAATLFALPGTPFVYYGEEIGMIGGEGNADENKRTPMRWTQSAPGFGFTTASESWFSAPEPKGTSVAAQTSDPASLLSWYRRLIALRKAHPALALGDATTIVPEGGGRGAFALLRERNGERVLYLANFHDESAPPFEVELGGTVELGDNGSAPRVLLAHGISGAITREGTKLRVEGLSPRSFVFISLPE